MNTIKKERKAMNQTKKSCKSDNMEKLPNYGSTHGESFDPMLLDLCP